MESIRSLNRLSGSGLGNSKNPYRISGIESIIESHICEDAGRKGRNNCDDTGKNETLFNSRKSNNLEELSLKKLKSLDHDDGHDHDLENCYKVESEVRNLGKELLPLTTEYERDGKRKNNSSVVTKMAMSPL